MELQGKVVFITGAARGIGKGYAEALLERGAKVFFGDVNSLVGSATLKEFEERFGKGRVRFAAFDVTNLQQFKDAFSKAVSEFGHVDIMVNNAGILNESAWELMININYIGVVNGTKLATEHMKKDNGGRGGRIINISSIGGLRDSKYAPIYVGTKHAVRAYTSSLALQHNLEEQGIEYGVLCPAVTDTDLISGLNAEKMNFVDEYLKVSSNKLGVSTVVNALLELLQLDKMNGSILLVEGDGNSYRKVEHRAV